VNSINQIKKLLVVNYIINKLDEVNKSIDLKVNHFSIGLFNKYKNICSSLSFSSQVKNIEIENLEKEVSVKRIAVIIKVLIIGSAIIVPVVILPIFSPFILLIETMFFKALENFNKKSNPKPLNDEIDKDKKDEIQIQDSDNSPYAKMS
jgi:hypothetical protein